MRNMGNKIKRIIKELSENINSFLKNNKLTQVAICKKMGFSRHTYVLIKNEKVKDMKLSTILKITEQCGKSVVIVDKKKGIR